MVLLRKQLGCKLFLLYFSMSKIEINVRKLSIKIAAQQQGLHNCNCIIFHFILHGMVWYCLVFYGIAWYCLIFYGIVRCCLLRLQHSIRSCTTAEEAAGLNLAFIAIITLIIIIFINDYLFAKTALSLELA